MHTHTHAHTHTHTHTYTHTQAPPEHANFYSERMQLLPVSAFRGEGAGSELILEGMYDKRDLCETQETYVRQKRPM